MQLNIFLILIFTLELIKKNRLTVNATSALGAPLPSSSGHLTTVQTLDAPVACRKSFQCIGTPNRGCPSLVSKPKFVSKELIAAIA